MEQSVGEFIELGNKMVHHIQFPLTWHDKLFVEPEWLILLYCRRKAGEIWSPVNGVSCGAIGHQCRHFTTLFQRKSKPQNGVTITMPPPPPIISAHCFLVTCSRNVVLLAIDMYLLWTLLQENKFPDHKMGLGPWTWGGGLTLLLITILTINYFSYQFS